MQVEWLCLDCTRAAKATCPPGLAGRRLFLLPEHSPPVLPKVPSSSIALDLSPRSPSGASLHPCFGNLVSMATEQGSKPV